MTRQANSLFDSVMRGMNKAAESNMKLQQDMLLNWTRFWPGFSGRGEDGLAGFSRLHEQWIGGVLSAMRTQRDFVEHQYDAALSSFDSLLGLAKGGNGEPAVVPKVPTSEPTEVLPSATAAPPVSAPVGAVEPVIPVGPAKNIHQKVAVVTGAASGIGEAVAKELAKRGAKAVLLVDRSDAVQELATSINKSMGRKVADAKVGDTTDEAFRKRVFNEAAEEHGLVSICVPAAGITRDSLAVKIDKETGKADIYPVETFRQVTEVNLIAPVYWGVEMVARIAEDRRQRGLKRWEPEETIQGVVVFLGSVSSQGNKGQISYAVTKAGLEGAAATLTKEAIFHGVRCAIIHPGFTDTPMARALGEDFLEKYVLPYTQLRRLIQPEEIADAICFMISNSAVSGELWADAGWHPPA